MRAFKIISSLDMSSGSECNKEMHAFNTIGTQQPLMAFAQSGDRVHTESRNRSQEISEVTKNSALFSGVSTLQRRVIKSKDSEEKTITYHLNLHPDSMKYTFSTTEPRKVSYYTEQQLLAHPGTSDARHSRMTELPHQNYNHLRNSKNLQCSTSSTRSNEVPVYEEKCTYCRPVVDLHTAEFVKRTIDKNKKLRCIVRDIIEARKEGKKQDVWNNFINDLKTKHGYNYYTYESVYVPKQYQLVSDNLRRYNLPSQCGTVRSWSNDNYNTPRNLEFIKRPYPNDMLCYPISSAAHIKHRLNSPIPNYLTTDCIIKQNPRRRKRRHSLVQTSTYRVESRHNTFKRMKDESEGHETCLCFAANTTDEYTLTDSTNKVEHATTTNLGVIDERSHGSECFCKKDKATFIHSEVALSEFEKKFRTCSTEVNTILKDLMKNETESNINDSTKPSDGNKINSKIQEYENYNLEGIDERSHESGCFCKKDKTTVMQSEIALFENEKKITTCSTEAETILKVLMNKNKECHINGSTKQANVTKIISTSQQHQTNLEGIDERCFCKNEKTTDMHSENALSENEKKFKTCSIEVDTILKDFMDKNVENNISDSTKQSDINKINSTSLRYENNLEEICNGSHGSGCKKDKITVMHSEIALSENEKKMRACSTKVDTILEDFTKKSNINDSTKQSDIKKINNTSQREECILDSDPQEKEGKHNQSSYYESESQHKENLLCSSAQEKDDKNHVSPIDSKNTQDKNLSGSSVQKNQEKIYQSSFNGQNQQGENPLGLYDKQKDEKNYQSPFSAQSQKVNVQNLLSSSDQEKDKTSLKNSFELINKGTYITVAKNANVFEEPVEQYKTSVNPLGKIEEKLDKVIETMNYILFEVKLRMLDMKTEKFDTATSTMSRNIAEERETCTAFNLIEEEINNNEYDNSDPNEICNKDLFKRSDRAGTNDNTTIKVGHINSFPATLNTTNNASICQQDFPATLGISNTKASNQKKLQNESLEHLFSRIQTRSIKKLDKDMNSILGGHFITTSKYIEERLSAVDQSIIDIKKVSKSFMEDLLRSKLNLIDENYDVPASSKQPTTISIENIVNRNLGSIKINNKAKIHQLCCVVTNVSGMQCPQYHHGSATNTAEMFIEDFCCSNDATMKKCHLHTHVSIDQAVSTEHQKPIETCDKCNSTKLLIAVDRAVSGVDENIFSKKNGQHSYILVDRAVSKIDDIILEEMRKSNQAKKEINDLLNRQFTNNYGVQIAFEIPTKERSTEVTDSLSTAKVSNKSSSKGKVFMSRAPNRSPLTIAAVNTDPMSLKGLFQLSANSMRQLLAVIYSGYSTYLPTVGRTLPVAGEAVQYLCHVCGAAFRKPSELSNHIRCYHKDSSRDCCVCRHMLQLRERSPGIFTCRFCGQMFTRAYCCELHERSCLRRGGRSMDVSESRAILK